MKRDAECEIIACRSLLLAAVGSGVTWQESGGTKPTGNSKHHRVTQLTPGRSGLSYDEREAIPAPAYRDGIVELIDALPKAIWRTALSVWVGKNPRPLASRNSKALADRMAG